MLDQLFTGLFAGAASVTFTGFLWCMLASLAIGALFAFTYCRGSACSRGFAATLALLPAAVCVVILMVSGNLGAGVAVAGTFSLVRFRSAPGSAKEICAVFLAMAAGLATGMGYVGYALLFSVVMAGMSLLYARFNLFERDFTCRRTLRVTVPEDLDYGGLFDDLFREYAREWRLAAVKTTNLGSLFRLTYQLTLRDAAKEKELIDKLRCRNGNLEISSSTQSTVPDEL